MPRPRATSRSGGAASGLPDEVLARVVREESARITAALTASFRSFDLAEESVADAVLEALREWRVRGIPPKPGAWLMQAARHNALDRLRRERVLRDKVALLEPAAEQADGSPLADERLALLFGCCHPALAPESQLALTLRAICGLTTAQIARATFSTEPATGQRISRAKRKIAASGIPLRVPEGADAAERLDLVLTVVSVMYSAAHFSPGGDAAADRDLAEDALWLAGVIAAALPRAAEAHGLRALLLFHRAREDARAVDGELILLGDQDRSRGMPPPGRRPPLAGARGHAAPTRAVAAARGDRGLPRGCADRSRHRLAAGPHLVRHAAAVRARLPSCDSIARSRSPRSRAPRRRSSSSTQLEEALAGYHLWHAVRAHVRGGSVAAPRRPHPICGRSN